MVMDIDANFREHYILAGLHFQREKDYPDPAKLMEFMGMRSLYEGITEHMAIGLERCLDGRHADLRESQLLTHMPLLRKSGLLVVSDDSVMKGIEDIDAVVRATPFLARIRSTLRMYEKGPEVLIYLGYNAVRRYLGADGRDIRDAVPELLHSNRDLGWQVKTYEQDLSIMRGK
jgi:hypothetical protein